MCNQLTVTRKLEVKKMKKERLLPKGIMITNSKGISYYQIGNKYYLTTGSLVREITYEVFEREVIKAKSEIGFNA